MGNHQLHHVRWESGALEESFRIWMKPVEDMANGRLTSDVMIQQFMDSTAQLWVMREEDELVGALVTEISKYPSGRRNLTILACGGAAGRMAPGIGEMEKIEAFARENKCDAVAFHGSTDACSGRAWARICPGFRETHTVFEKELRYGQ